MFVSVFVTGEEKSAEDILKKLEDKPIDDTNSLPQAVLTRIIANDEYGMQSINT